MVDTRTIRNSGIGYSFYFLIFFTSYTHLCSRRIIGETNITKGSKYNVIIYFTSCTSLGGCCSFLVLVELPMMNGYLEHAVLDLKGLVPGESVVPNFEFTEQVFQVRNAKISSLTKKLPL